MRTCIGNIDRFSNQHLSMLNQTASTVIRYNLRKQQKSSKKKEQAQRYEKEFFSLADPV